MFPKATHAQAMGRSSTPLIARSFVYIGGFCLVAVLAAAVVGKPLVSVVYGNEYKEIAYLLPWYIGAVSLLSVSTVMMYYNLSLSSNRHLLPLVATVVLQIMLFVFLHHSPFQIVLALILSLTPLFLMNAVIQFTKAPNVGGLPAKLADGGD